MPAKSAFSEAQAKLLQDAAKRLLKRKYKTQEEMALGLGITQPSVSAIILGKWVPSIVVARHIANGLGTRLEDLVGPYGRAAGTETNGVPVVAFSNLDVCLQFHAPQKTWRPWTVAAAKAGIFGEEDFPPADWPPKLDALEKDLERFRTFRERNA